MKISTIITSILLSISMNILAHNPMLVESKSITNISNYTKLEMLKYSDIFYDPYRQAVVSINDIKYIIELQNNKGVRKVVARIINSDYSAPIISEYKHNGSSRISSISTKDNDIYIVTYDEDELSNTKFLKLNVINRNIEEVNIPKQWHAVKVYNFNHNTVLFYRLKQPNSENDSRNGIAFQESNSSEWRNIELPVGDKQAKRHLFNATLINKRLIVSMTDIEPDDGKYHDKEIYYLDLTDGSKVWQKSKVPMTYKGTDSIGNKVYGTFQRMSGIKKVDETTLIAVSYYKSRGGYFISAAAILLSTDNGSTWRMTNIKDGDAVTELFDVYKHRDSYVILTPFRTYRDGVVKYYRLTEKELLDQSINFNSLTPDLKFEESYLDFYRFGLPNDYNKQDLYWSIVENKKSEITVKTYKEF